LGVNEGREGKYFEAKPKLIYDKMALTGIEHQC
jgi:hypothetical protein